MIVNSATKFRIDKFKYNDGYMSPVEDSKFAPQKQLLQNSYQDIKRPLKQNPSDLSFKGLSSLGYKQLKTIYSKSEFFKFSDKYLGGMGRELFDDVTKTQSSRTSNLIKVDGDNITIFKKSVPHLALDGILYPFKILPGDILNGLVELMGKIPGLKKTSQNLLEKDFFRNIRQRSKIDAKVNSLTGLITYRDVKIQEALESRARDLGKKVKDLTDVDKALVTKNVDAELDSNVFQSELKMFDPKSGNYDTKHERALNRLVSGLPPALFLANDAYNLSRMMDDDPTVAEQERKTRFKQEVSRILSSGYLTLITMGAFQKLINKSKLGIVLMTGTTVLVTEMFSRLSNGKHISRLTPEEARRENALKNAPEAKITPIENKGNQVSMGNSENKDTSDKAKEQKPLLSFDTLLKASAVVLGLGYGIKGLKNLPFVKNAAFKYLNALKSDYIIKSADLTGEALETINKEHKFKQINLPENFSKDDAVSLYMKEIVYKPFTKLYNKMTQSVYHVDKAKFDSVVDTLRANGFGELADKYKAVGHSALSKDGTYIDLGVKDKGIKPAVNFVIAPFKFIWNTVTLPYWMIDEKLMSVFRKSKPRKPAKDIDALAKSFAKISEKAEKLASQKISPEAFKDYIQVNLLKAFNVDSLSSVSNAELSNLAKTAASVATIWFLMTDNYNMVMLKSNGNDKDGANTKFKERFVQEGSRLFYQTLLIDLFNSTFRNSYNSSLLGMSWVTLADTTLGEILTRSSVGTPIKAHTRDELIAIETEQNQSTGFKKKYFNFMQRLTGKRSIKSYEVKQNKVPETQANQSESNNNFETQILFKQNEKPVFKSFTAKIKG